MGAGRPSRAKASYMSVQFGAFKYRYRQELSQSSRESANGARPRTRQFALPGPNPINWRVRGGAPFALPREDWDNSWRWRYLREPDCTLT